MSDLDILDEVRHEAAEDVVVRAEQADPITMYLVVRESLGMSAGKIGAQCGHAVGMLDRKHDKQIAAIEAHFDPVYGPPNDLEGRIPERVKKALDIWYEWNQTSFRKVVLKADEKEWVKLKALAEVPKVIVVDAGLTEIEPNTETVIGLWPMRKSERPVLVKRLQLLK